MVIRMMSVKESTILTGVDALNVPHRPYRAPELLFGSRSYNPFALDRWALGAAISSFFTAVGPTRPPSPDSDEPYSPFMAAMPSGPIVRSTLFEGALSDFALIGSIFKILGTPTLETWPVNQSCLHQLWEEQY